MSYLNDTLAGKSPISVQTAKKAFYATSDTEYFKALEFMNDILCLLCTTYDAKEGINAFLKKRASQWKEC